MTDVTWLGFDWEGLYYASDYFHQLHDWAVQLIKAGKAYVDDLSADEMREIAARSLAREKRARIAIARWKKI